MERLKGVEESQQEKQMEQMHSGLAHFLSLPGISRLDSFAVILNQSEADRSVFGLSYRHIDTSTRRHKGIFLCS